MRSVEPTEDRSEADTMLRKLAVTAGFVTILGVAAYFAPHEAQAAGLLPALLLMA